MRRSFLVLSLLVVLVVPGLVLTQELPSGSSSSPDTPQNVTTGDSSTIDTQGIKNYLLGPGDTLDVRVFGQSDLNAIVEVDTDGNLSSLPFLDAPIFAKCRTEKELQKDITKAYAKYH